MKEEERGAGVPLEKRDASMNLRLLRLIYLFTSVLSFYFLFESRSGEASTVWGVMHPAFLPSFFAATFVLVVIIFSSDRVEYKLLFIVIHSIIIHSFLVVIFPTGRAAVSHIVLGRTRRVFDNIVLHGPWGWESQNVLHQLYLWIRGTNFQAAYSIILARMFGTDVYWTHQLFIPLLWSTLVPITAFKISKSLGMSNTVSALSGLMGSAFPAMAIWGASCTPNSLGFIFFFFSVFFCLRYVSLSGVKTFFLMLVSCLASLLSHVLVGTISISLLFLSLGFRGYTNLKKGSPAKAKILLLISIVLSTLVLPLALGYQRFFYPSRASFTLDTVSELSVEDIIWYFLLGRFIEFDVKTMLIEGVGPLLGLIGILYSLGVDAKKSPKTHTRMCVLFLSLAFFIVLIDYRILKLFMVSVGFGVERLWLFRDFLAVPFIAIILGKVVTYLRKVTSKHTLAKVSGLYSTAHLGKLNLRFALGCTVIFLSLSGWIVGCVYYGYPRYGGLQVTSYEVDAVKYIETTTHSKYVVICDQWIIYAGEIFVGVYNPHAFYFAHSDYRINELFLDMLENPSPSPMIRAMAFNNSTIAYFVIQQPRWPLDFEKVVAQASIALKIYAIFEEGKLYVFSYEKTV